MQEGMEGNPAAGTMKKVSRVLAVLTVPFTMGFPKVRLSLSCLARNKFSLLSILSAFKIVYCINLEKESSGVL